MRFWLLVVSAALMLFSTGCHKSASAHVRDAHMDQPILQTYAQASATDATQGKLAPSDLATLHQEKGVALGLEIDGRTFHAGQNVPLLLVYEDLAAARPVSSTDCSGFSVTIEAVDQGRNDVAPIEHCVADSGIAENDVALEKGNLRFLHTSLMEARQELTQPGRYLIRATWQSYIPRKGAFRQSDGYTVAHSNVVPITITR